MLGDPTTEAAHSTAHSRARLRLLFDGDPAEAAQAWTRLGCTYDAAMALADPPDEAALREALGILTSPGARPAAGSIRQRLSCIGAVEDLGASAPG